MCPKLIELLSWNGPTVHVCCFMLARASTKTFVSQIQKTAKKKSSLAEKLVSKATRQPRYHSIYENFVIYPKIWLRNSLRPQMQFVCKTLKSPNVCLALFSRPAKLSRQLRNKRELTLAKFRHPSSSHYRKTRENASQYTLHFQSL